MYAAPPVSVRGTGGPAWRAVQAILPMLGVGAFAVWALAHAGLSMAPALPSALLAGGLGWWRATGAAATLAWDGQTWAVDGQAGTVQVAIDLDRWLLLRCDPAAPGGARRWLALSAAEVGLHWPLLRAALYGLAPMSEVAAAAAPVEHV